MWEWLACCCFSSCSSFVPACWFSFPVLLLLVRVLLPCCCFHSRLVLRLMLSVIQVLGMFSWPLPRDFSGNCRPKYFIQKQGNPWVEINRRTLANVAAARALAALLLVWACFVCCDAIVSFAGATLLLYVFFAFCCCGCCHSRHSWREYSPDVRCVWKRT